MKDTKSHEELRTALIAKAAADNDFRARLVREPKPAIREALGLELPESVAVHVHEETAMNAHLVLPPSPQLTDAELQAVAAGHTIKETYGGGNVTHLHRNPDGSWYAHE